MLLLDDVVFEARDESHHVIALALRHVLHLHLLRQREAFLRETPKSRGGFVLRCKAWPRLQTRASCGLAETPHYAIPGVPSPPGFSEGVSECAGELVDRASREGQEYYRPWLARHGVDRQSLLRADSIRRQRISS
jgi:hypothetical protein